MIRKFSVWLSAFVVVLGLLSFGNKKEKTSYVEVTTSFGIMKFRLFNATPLHRDNFIKLAKDDFFDDLLFHRVINQFMIQGGDPDSKGAEKGRQLGNGGPGYTIDAEFISGIIHKKGALAAAREGDTQNPLKRSSGSQFYIVQGKVLDSSQVMYIQNKKLEKYRNEELKACLADSENSFLLDAYKTATKNKDEHAIQEVLDSADVIIAPNLEKYKYTQEQIEVYKTVGGTPHLDYEYTVFGEMVEGFDVLDSIAKVDVNRDNRPIENMVMKVKVVRK